jgi:membrane associated rhomboid family serine protease
VDRLLSRLERRLGRYAPQGIILWIVGFSGVLHLLVFARPDAARLLWLDPGAVLHGEVWRVLTFLFAPAGPVSGTGLFWTALYLWFLHTMGTSLEAQWGSFRFDLFFLLGAVGTLLVGFFVGPVTGEWVATALLLAFAVEFPDYEVLLIVLPVKVKWLGLLSGGWMIWQLVAGGLQIRAAIVVALLDFLLFCGSDLLGLARGATRGAARGARRTAAPEGFGPAVRRTHVCAKCGRSDKDDPSLEFRVCDCQEKCHGKLTEYCLEHARDH